MLTNAQFLAEVERFLAETGMSPSGFGRKAMNDSGFVYRLREGRKTTLDNAKAVLDFIEDQRQKAA